MQSMTGYGQSMAHIEGWTVTMEISSVNRRSLELSFNMPREWQMLERELTAQAKERIGRGKVNVYIRVESDIADSLALTWDDSAAAATLDRLKTLAKTQSIAFAPDASFLLNLVKSLGNEQELPPEADVQELLVKTFGQALNTLIKMRTEEGRVLAQDLSDRLNKMAQYLKEITTHSEGSVTFYRDNLLQRLKNAGLDLNCEDERVLKELALFADRSDISEEITRLGCHIDQFHAFLKSDEMIGRKMDFLCQEMHRELNTMGSKATKIEVTKIVIDAKNELERIREQVQNIE